MNISRDIVNYIESKTSHVIGTNLFLGHLPDTNSNGIIVSHSGGDENESLMQRWNVYIIAHYNDYQTANDKLEAIYNLLAFSNGITITSGYIHNIVPMKLPGFITVTEQNKHVFSFSLVCYITRP
jgi:hypothetical protein